MRRLTRDEIIRTAHELFYQQGFHAVGIDQIIKKVGVTKSTFYNHFESKDDLVLAVLKWRDGLWPKKLRANLQRIAGDLPRDQLLALFDVLDEVFGAQGFNGCLFIRAASEYPLAHDPIHVIVQSHVQTLELAIREMAGYAGANDPETLAKEIMHLVAGAYVLSQMDEGNRAPDIGKKMAVRLVNEHIPAKPPREKQVA
jgi:AcrR family transcriptional regulator